jgi:hypothetical protein
MALATLGDKPLRPLIRARRARENYNIFHVIFLCQSFSLRVLQSHYSGSRSSAQHIDFGEDLPEVPAVVLGITELESTFDPVRVAVEAKNVNVRGFDAEIRTWSDTHVLSCGGFWIASSSDLAEK